MFWSAGLVAAIVTLSTARPFLLPRLCTFGELTSDFVNTYRCFPRRAVYVFLYLPRRQKASEEEGQGLDLRHVLQLRLSFYQPLTVDIELVVGMLNKGFI